MSHVLEVEPAGFNLGGTEQFIVKNIHDLDREKFSVSFLCCGHIYDEKAFERFRESFDSAESALEKTSLNSSFLYHCVTPILKVTFF